MSRGFIIAGTDTGIGKTVFAAGLAGALDGAYWKPVQAGLDGDTDSAIVAGLTGFGGDRILREAYRLRLAASPHLAAAHEGLLIDRHALVAPVVGDLPLIIETAGGLLVPLTQDLLQIDVLAAWRRPVILCAATRLGTINHTLLSLEALRRRDIAVHGVAFIGQAADSETVDDVEATIVRLGQVRRLGRLPWVDPLTAEALLSAFTASFDIDDFAI